MSRARRLAALAASAALAACGSSGEAPAPTTTSTGAASALAASTTTAPSAPTASGSLPSARVSSIPPEVVAREVNPSGLPPYPGPTATLRGKVRIEGSPPPDQPHVFGSKCGEAAATYGKLFRVGLEGGVADVLVAVTGPENTFVPAKSPVVTVDIKGCALSSRTIVVTFGQRIDVRNRDGREVFMPLLEEAAGKTAIVAVPHGDSVPLLPPSPSRYTLVDKLGHDFFRADVWALKFSTHAVTDLNGRYEISGIPVGKVHVNAFLPATGSTVEKALDLKAGETTLDLALKYPAQGAQGPAANAPPSVPSAKKPAQKP